jgi:hypothetical protein
LTWTATDIEIGLRPEADFFPSGAAEIRRRSFTNGKDPIGILNSVLGEPGIGTLKCDGTAPGSSAALFEAVASASTPTLHDTARLIFDTSTTTAALQPPVGPCSRIWSTPA